LVGLPLGSPLDGSFMPVLLLALQKTAAGGEAPAFRLADLAAVEHISDQPILAMIAVACVRSGSL
jgi:hypothetical protein